MLLFINCEVGDRNIFLIFSFFWTGEVFFFFFDNFGSIGSIEQPVTTFLCVCDSVAPTRA